MTSALFNLHRSRTVLRAGPPPRLPSAAARGLQLGNVRHQRSGPSSSVAATPSSPGTSARASRPWSTPSPPCSLPAHRISYNKAAGADTRERDLRSYVEGHYKSERNETTGASRPVGLRDTRHFSVILGVFANVDFGTTVTLAQVFRTREAGQGQPERFFVVADSRPVDQRPTSPTSAPSWPPSSAGCATIGARTYDTFPEYGKDFRRRLGIESEQAMELFHQTVSMKAVDNLNDFVRSHMLEPFDTKAQIDALVEHFDNLTRAHEAVVRARDQLELLGPLVVVLDRYDGAERPSRRDRPPAGGPALLLRRARPARCTAAGSTELDRRGSRSSTPNWQRRTPPWQRCAPMRQASASRSPATAVTGWRPSTDEIRRHQQEKPRRQERLERFNESSGRRRPRAGSATAVQFAASQGAAAVRRTELERRASGGPEPI